MARTAQEEAELQRLLAERERRRALEAARAEASREIPAGDGGWWDGFSLSRLAGGILQDTWNGLVDTLNWFGDLRDDAFGAVSGGLSYDPAEGGLSIIEGQGLLDARSKDPLRQKEREETFKVEVVGESDNTIESVTRSIGGFLIPYMGVAKIGKVGQATTLTGRIGRELAAVTTVNMAFMDAQETNLANTLRDSFGFDNAVIDALVSEEDDDLMVSRFKAAISNLPLEIVGTAVVEGGIQGIKVLRGMRAANAEQRALIESTRQDLAVKTFQQAEPKAAAAAAEGAPKVTPKAAASTADTADTAGTQASEDFILEAKDVLRGLADDPQAPKIKTEAKPIRTFDDVITFIKGVVDQVPPGQERYLEDLAERLMKEPHQALSEIGVDPLRLNLDDVVDADSIMAIRDGLSDMIEYVARRTGESRGAGGKKISWAQTIKEAKREVALSARALGSSWRAVENTVRNTQTLRRDMMAARMLVGANAQRLVGSVEAALEEVGKGIQHGPAWTNFVKRLNEHALLEGALTGAQSEVARTLNILKASTTAIDPAKLVDDAAESAESALSKKYEELFADLATDAGRVRLLNQIKQNGGDLESLSKVVKARRQGRLQRVDAALSELKGNLFSFGTVWYNVGSAATMQFFDAANNLLSGLALKGIGSFTRNEQILQGAAIQLNKGFAAFDAPIQAFSQAVRSALKITGAEWLDEAAVMLDTVGLEKWAKSMAVRSAAMGDDVQRGWLKKDMRNGQKGIYISPEELRRSDAKIRELSEKFPVGSFGQMALEWTMRGAARGAATGYNLAGSLTRGSLSLFISGPDTFAGTISAQIGRNVKAVELATEEAIEAGLKGADFASYVKGRSKDLGDLVDDGTSPRAFTDAQKDLMERAGNKYAARNNFADDLESTSLKAVASAFENAPIIGTLSMPFPRTPLRVMETTLIDYTPLGLIKHRVRDAFINGDAATRGEIATRYVLATSLLGAAYAMAANGTLVGQDGGWQNTARRKRPSYSIKIGADYYDISRLDPIGTILGIVADAHYATTLDADNLDPLAEEQGVPGKVGELMIEAAFWPLMQNVFNKAMLESLDDVMGISQARTPEDMGEVFERFQTSMATRFVPASGVQRQIDKFDDGTFRAARGFADGWLKASIGADSLPPRLDPLTGRPAPMPLAERLSGLKGGPSEATAADLELARLAFTLQPPDRRQNGVTLTQVQYNRYLELRGHQVELGGKTLEQRIDSMIRDDRWGRLSDPAKIEQIKETISPYSAAAKQALLREDDDFRFRSLMVENRERYSLIGRPMEEADAETRALAEKLGIQHNY